MLKNILRGRLTTLQVNLGNLCNQRCIHCHVDAGPDGGRIMSKEIVDSILRLLWKNRGLILDITGGAPELNPWFSYLVCNAKGLVKEIIVRSNLTVLFEPGKEYLAGFFREHNIHLICSMPCYTKENVDRQRGRGVFEKSIKALKALNGLGFGNGEGLILDLVHNPDGPHLAQDQDRLEADYKGVLGGDYGITFNRLIAITNVPVNRFRDYLGDKGYTSYVNLLKDNFNPRTAENLMCRTLLSIGWDGSIYDCDFNQALGLALKDLTIDNIDGLEGRDIILGEHCLGCTAGFGSSCQGALDNIRDDVRDFYKTAAVQPKKELCCPTSYDKDDISFIPKDILDVSYGCGSPITLARPMEGNVVVDLGCGAGIDCFIASKKVGATGRVIGIDMTEEMLDKAYKASMEVARNLGFSNCEFRKGFLEDVPVESGTADLVTSNCVVNLSSDKSRVFKEVYRILKDGGRFVISDIVSDKEVPHYMKEDKILWGECISGALTQGDFLSKAKEAGFYGLRILKNFRYRLAGGIQFCSITVEGYKFNKGKDCVYIGQYATYLGPYSEVRDDDGHTFPRGAAVEICTDTAAKLGKEPYKGHFVISEAGKDSVPAPCCPDNDNPCC